MRAAIFKEIQFIITKIHTEYEFFSQKKCLGATVRQRWIFTLCLGPFDLTRGTLAAKLFFLSKWGAVSIHTRPSCIHFAGGLLQNLAVLDSHERIVLWHRWWRVANACTKIAKKAKVAAAKGLFLSLFTWRHYYLHLAAPISGGRQFAHP